jgi:hypothetical protein
MILLRITNSYTPFIRIANPNERSDGKPCGEKTKAICAKNAENNLLVRRIIATFVAKFAENVFYI